jgi:PAS domain S-box-containing protein
MTEDPVPWSRAGPQVMFGMDRHGVCTMSVGPGLAALGYADGQLVGTSLLELYRDDPAILASVHRALAGESFTATRELDGRILWVYYQALVDPDGLFTGSLAVTTDVTDQLADAQRAAAAEVRADTLARLAGTLGREVVVPQDVLDVGVRIATSALAEAGVAWLLTDAGRVERLTAWHADDDVRRGLQRGLGRVPTGSGWTDPGRIGELTEPVRFDRRETRISEHEPAEVSRVVDGLGLVHGLRMPLRSRGRTIGAVDFVRSREGGAFSDDDVAFATEIGGRFALAYDNALLLQEQREGLRTLAKFESLADASDDLIVIADNRGCATYVNPRVRAAGLELHEDDIWASVAAYSDADRAREMRAAVLAGERWRGDVSLDTGDPDRELCLYVDAFPLAVPGSGEPMGVAWIAQDVTQLRAAERRLRSANAELGLFQALVEASVDFIAIARLDGKVSYLNPAGRTMVGLAPDADVTDTTIADYLTPDGLERSLAVEQPAVRDRGSWEGESTLQPRDGRPPIPVAIASFLIHDLVTGEPIGLATVQRDVTERVAAAARVHRLAEHRQALLMRLVEAQEAERTQIAADVHDDPVQAIAAVDLRLGLLRRRVEEQAPQLIGFLDPVQQSVARANERLRELLFDLEAPDVERGLGPALRRAADEIFHHDDVEVGIVADDEPPVDTSVRTVAYRITLEALINVRKHARARRVLVRVGGRNGGLSVDVADDGIGLGAHAPRSAPGHHGVTGMRDRASVAGGEVRFSDRPEGGTLVSVWLPAGTGTSARRG